MLTTLGIFVAIVIAVVAAYLSVLIVGQQEQGNINTLSLSTSLLLGHILTNIIFLFLYLIGKMTARPVSVICKVYKKPSCTDCPYQDQCRSREKLWLRYPSRTSCFHMGHWTKRTIG